MSPWFALSLSLSLSLCLSVSLCVSLSLSVSVSVSVSVSLSLSLWLYVYLTLSSFLLSFRHSGLSHLFPLCVFMCVCVCLYVSNQTQVHIFYDQEWVPKSTTITHVNTYTPIHICAHTHDITTDTQPSPPSLPPPLYIYFL